MTAGWLQWMRGILRVKLYNFQTLMHKGDLLSACWLMPPGSQQTPSACSKQTCATCVITCHVSKLQLSPLLTWLRTNLHNTVTLANVFGLTRWDSDLNHYIVLCQNKCINRFITAVFTMKVSGESLFASQFGFPSKCYWNFNQIARNSAKKVWNYMTK